MWIWRDRFKNKISVLTNEIDATNGIDVTYGNNTNWIYNIGICNFEVLRRAELFFEFFFNLKLLSHKYCSNVWDCLSDYLYWLKKFTRTTVGQVILLMSHMRLVKFFWHNIYSDSWNLHDRWNHPNLYYIKVIMVFISIIFGSSKECIILIKFFWVLSSQHDE